MALRAGGLGVRDLLLMMLWKLKNIFKVL